jgi:hypothetical protein
MTQPINVRVFGGEAFVLTAQHVPQAFNRIGQIHIGLMVAGWDGR